MNLIKKSALFLCLFIYSCFCVASVPNEITLGGITYTKVDQNVIGNHKSCTYLKKDETLTNWSSMVAIHYFMNENNPTQFVQNKYGATSKIIPIDGDKNNILQIFDTMNPLGKVGDPIIFQQNIWRYQKLNFGKGMMSVVYTTSKIVPNQTTPEATQGVSQNIQDEIKALPLDSYSF